VHPGLRTFRDEFSATVVRIVAYIGAMAVLAVGLAKMLEAPVVAAIDPKPRSNWSTIDRPYRAFTLTVPGFADPEPNYAIRRHTAGGRKDVLSLGGTEGAHSRLMIEIYRPGKELARFGDPAGEVAARTAEVGSAQHLAAVEPINGKFGPVPVFKFTATASGGARNCLGFARAFQEPHLQIAGWYCKGAAEVIDRMTLGCAIEGLSLLAAASEPKVQELFARAEQRRKFCATKPAKRGPTLRRKDWIDASAQPKLRRGAVK
jgi:hypothetical protein